MSNKWMRVMVLAAMATLTGCTSEGDEASPLRRPRATDLRTGSCPGISRPVSCTGTTSVACAATYRGFCPFDQVRWGT